jgi:hypothetical protein
LSAVIQIHAWILAQTFLFVNIDTKRMIVLDTRSVFTETGANENEALARSSISTLKAALLWDLLSG